MSNETMSFSPADTLDPSVIDEVKMWSELLAVLFQGLPVPFNPAKMLIKINQEQDKYQGEIDFSHLMKCCYDIAEIKEVKHLKPMIAQILNRIIFLTNLNVRDIKFNDYE